LPVPIDAAPENLSAEVSTSIETVICVGHSLAQVRNIQDAFITLHLILRMHWSAALERLDLVASILETFLPWLSRSMRSGNLRLNSKSVGLSSSTLNSKILRTAAAGRPMSE
jgi:hypothetical protein